MAAWRSPLGGIKTMDSSVTLFDLDTVLEETRAVRDVTSPISRKRVEMLSAVEDVLAL